MVKLRVQHWNIRNFNPIDVCFTIYIQKFIFVGLRVLYLMFCKVVLYFWFSRLDVIFGNRNWNFKLLIKFGFLRRVGDLSLLICLLTGTLSFRGWLSLSKRCLSNDIYFRLLLFLDLLELFLNSGISFVLFKLTFLALFEVAGLPNTKNVTFKIGVTEIGIKFNTYSTLTSLGSSVTVIWRNWQLLTVYKPS